MTLITKMPFNEIVFQVPENARWYCTFSGESQGNVWIQVYDVDDIHRHTLGFPSCAYIRFPHRWNAANFRTGTIDECQQHLDTLPAFVKERWQSKDLYLPEVYFQQRTLFISDVDNETDQPLQVIFVAEKIYIQDVTH